MEKRYAVYMLSCADGSYYVGTTDCLERRLAMHIEGVEGDAYTRSRRPIVLVWSEEFADHDSAFRCERRIKGWSRAKKTALIRGDFEGIHCIVTAERKRRERAKRGISQP